MRGKKENGAERRERKIKRRQREEQEMGIVRNFGPIFWFSIDKVRRNTKSHYWSIEKLSKQPKIPNCATTVLQNL